MPKQALPFQVPAKKQAPKLKLVVDRKHGPRLYRTDYANGSSRPGYCASLESACIAAMKHVLFDGYTSATISCMISGYDVVRIRLNDAKTGVIVKSLVPFNPHRKETTH